MGAVVSRRFVYTSKIRSANVPIARITATNTTDREDLLLTVNNTPALFNPMYCLPKSFIFPELSINAFAFKRTIWDQSTRRKA